MILTEKCPTCSSRLTLCKHIAGNGGEHITKWCTGCNRGSQPVSKDKVESYLHGLSPGLTTEYLPTTRDYTLARRCSRCGARGAEEHHWAPRYLFQDADDWPKDYLCRDCHLKWHNLVTPNMSEVKP